MCLSKIICLFLSSGSQWAVKHLEIRVWFLLYFECRYLTLARCWFHFCIVLWISFPLFSPSFLFLGGCNQLCSRHLLALCWGSNQVCGMCKHPVCCTLRPLVCCDFVMEGKHFHSTWTKGFLKTNVFFFFLKIFLSLWGLVLGCYSWLCLGGCTCQEFDRIPEVQDKHLNPYTVSAAQD